MPPIPWHTDQFRLVIHSFIMVNLRYFVASGLLFKVAAAINLTVSATGGNSSSPLIYGLMFEVRKFQIQISDLQLIFV